MLNSKKVLLPVFHCTLEECFSGKNNMVDLNNYVINLKKRGNQMILSGNSKKCAIDGGDMAQKFFNNFGVQNIESILKIIFNEYFKDSPDGVVYSLNLEKKRIYFFPAK